MQYEFDFAVFIGRFQPFHNGHLQVVGNCLAKAEKLIILIGSAGQARSSRNPWFYCEREQMIRSCLSIEDNERLLCSSLVDVPYNDELWGKNVLSEVSGLVSEHQSYPQKQPSIALVSYKKDYSGCYLNLFPQWKKLDVDNYDEINATSIREKFFSSEINTLLAQSKESFLPEPIIRWLGEFARIDAGYKQISEELMFIRTYRKSWEVAPYEPTFVTVDAVLIQCGYILLIERRGNPGKGLWALPGGFVDTGERIFDACMRELREETCLKIPESVLRRAVKHQAVYDDPYRSARGRTITHAFQFELEQSAILPKVEGGDDAKSAQWIPLNDLKSEDMFEDHYFIIQDMLTSK